MAGLRHDHFQFPGQAVLILPGNRCGFFSEVNRGLVKTLDMEGIDYKRAVDTAKLIRQFPFQLPEADQ